MNRDEYAKLIYFWHGAMENADDREPFILKLPELLGDLQDKGWGNTDGRAAAIAGVVSALKQTLPDVMYGWSDKFPRLFESVMAVHRRFPCAERADYLIAYWIISHDDAAMDRLLDLIADGGTIGQYARRQADGAAERARPFRRALNAAKDRRREAMVIK